MPISKNTYKLSNKAEEDLLSIAYYTIDKFGANQARTYRDDLIKTLEFLVLNPHLGRVLFLENDTIKRHHYKSHMIFFKETEYGILIVRILGGNMDFKKHL